MFMLAMADSLHCYGHVLRREYDYVLRMALDFEVEGRKGGRRGHGIIRLRKKV